MIAQLLNRDRILDQLQEVKTQLQLDVAAKREGGAQPDAADLIADDYREALAALEQTEVRERAESSGQSSFPPQPSDRRAAPPAPLDDFSFFSRDPIVSNLQSALDQYWATKAANAPPLDDRRGLVPGRRGVMEEVAVTDQSIPGVSLTRTPAGRRIFNKFSITDPRWVSSAFASGIRLFRGKREFNSTPPDPVRIDDRTRLVIVGDWGTGIPRARKVSDQMRVWIAGAAAQKRSVHVIHLGDVYYSGWRYEYMKRFLPYWPVDANDGAAIPSWCLMGNHDMYSGGYAFYGTLLSDMRFAKQQRCSYFSLYNQHWRILGLDTAWDDNGLKDPQGVWAKDLASRDDRKLLLLSHHQLFSAYESTGTVIGTKLRPVLDTNRVRAWFWGHEHRCMLFDDHQKVGFARCIGHGGVPVYMSHKQNDPYPSPGAYEYRAVIEKGLEKWALFGFVVIDFEDSRLHVRYIDENGFQYKDEKIE
ncbi:calcineurin-like phosphoesterase family protein [Edaphobacter aggregans]|uniref:Calcineurin-like phosphoesterase family protein n=1 Tax=Edaphobacter aggregans TaxID=570835 RepID=A0A428MN75_9BACT|nr:metallophosphoesterase [Edaphobacter aggregans]RSL18359.1 calcineurin-like phosphoesterase family protein [Edaphobacter aggregans]